MRLLCAAVSGRPRLAMAERLSLVVGTNMSIPHVTILTASIALLAAGFVACEHNAPPPSTPPATPGGECAVERCGPAPGMPAQQCPDGSIGGNTGRCILLSGGTCGWEIRSCPSDPGAPSPTAGGECVRGGCSGTVCTEPGQTAVTTCEFRPEYACYQSAKCERQPAGACGWTETDALKRCLANPPQP